MFCEILVKFIDKFHQIEKNYKGVDENIVRTKSGKDLLERLNAFDDRLLFFRNTANCNYSAQCAQSSQFGN